MGIIMCIGAVALNVHPSYPFVFIFNRDEGFERACAKAAEWGNIIAGKDLVGEGTWLGINRQGRFAAVTNFCENDPEVQAFQESDMSVAIGDPSSSYYTTRGEIPLTLLTSDRQLVDELGSLDLARYKSFNLLAGEMKAPVLHYVTSNRQGLWAGLNTFTEGVHAVSNCEMKGPLKKTSIIEQLLNDYLASHAEVQLEGLFEILTNSTIDVYEGEPAVRDAAIFCKSAPLFIFGGMFTEGTVSSTVVLCDTTGRVTFVERTWDASQTTHEDTELSFSLDNQES
jgi:uncharacterized protein with NRDE domain